MEDDKFELYEGDWFCSMNMGIEELRVFYDHICYSIEVWPGSPRRPAEEQEYLKILKSRVFAMIMQYQLDNS